MIQHAPAAELSRSPAAARVGALAAESGLFLAHFEHRWEPDWPEDWQPRGRPDLGERATWVAGTLPETKFRTFQLDRLIGSLHPSHGAKWTAHELCHGLVGFGWRPGASRRWLATAARLAELLPVALWYFLDEGGLRRCPDHDGPLYGARCRRCEAAAAPSGADPTEWYRRGRAFVEAELAAVARTRRLGRPVPHRHATLELCSDGLAYVSAHGARLESAAFHRYAETFFAAGQGHHDTLDDLEGRVLGLLDHLTGGPPAPALAGDRWRWITQDLGWRLLVLHADSEGELAAALDPLIDRLATDPSEAAVTATVSAYREIHAEWVLPSPGDVFGVGYPLPGGLGVSEAQLAEGVASALPATWVCLGEEAEELVSDFAHGGDRSERSPLGRRFAAFLARAEESPALVDQARFEAAVTHAIVGDAAEVALGAEAPADAPVVRAQGVEVVVVHHAVTTDPAAAEDAETLLPLDEALHLAVRRAPDGEVDVLQLDPEAAEGLDSPAGADPEVRATLLSLGLLVPAAWAC